ncbi:hypothetical protein M8C21_033593 [Ambrosia artemisiifolia]|uniref:F-box domain-containing protein n=1 Tax=Ambrosia artemisiifolia TaxID=4212 RepID=A0AAD5GWI6_AMBAR|nr:hypothetical protein M8C21_033593 [Ambrosia artemisiifolia]
MEHQNPTSGNKTECQNLDIISTLPQHIIGSILSLMPLRDALRTSILSKKWRYAWQSMPTLVFTDDMVKLPSDHCCAPLKKYKLVSAIFHVLLLHNGPTRLDFNCLFGNLCLDSEFAQIISYLAKGNKLKDLFFINVEVSAQMLQQFLSKCPLLESFSLIEHQTRIDFVAGENKFTFVDLLQCVPLVKALDISKYYMKYLCAGGMPHKLPTSLVRLKYLYLHVCLAEKNEISSALCMIMSSPLLEEIGFLMYDNEKLPVQQTPTNFLDPEHYPDMNLDHLVSFWIENFSNLPLEMDFVKLILAKSPKLQKQYSLLSSAGEWCDDSMTLLMVRDDGGGMVDVSSSNIIMDNKTQCLISDIISSLPQNIIENILSLIPLRDALRTSVLSKKWRYAWRSMPKLVFTNNMVKLPSGSAFEQWNYKLVKAMFHVLLLHDGPTTLVFSCSIVKLGMVSEFEQILSYLSKGNKLKRLTLLNDNRSYKLPSSLFSLQGLESIHLQMCTFVPPLTFNRFSSLTSLSFINVEVSGQMLQRFLSECPLLEHIRLLGYQQAIEFVEQGNKFTFVDLLRCVPLIMTLEISGYYMKYLCAGGMPHKLPTSLVHLKYLLLQVCITEQNEISSALCMIRSSPLLVKIVFLMYDNKGLPVPQTSTSFVDPEDYSNLKLDHLDMFEIKMFSSKLPLAMDLVKLIMAKSPVLKTVQIELMDDVSVDEEVKMLRDLQQQHNNNNINMEYQNTTTTQSLNSDIISTLPQNIIEDILTLMPLQHALRTSILSKKWRYAWRSMPTLVFTHNMVKRPTDHCCPLLNKYKLVNAIFHVLLLHNGPTTLEFNSSIGNLCMDSEFALIISYLAKGNKIKELNFDRVELSAQTLQQFLSKCPLLERICLFGRQTRIAFVAGQNKFTFVDLLQCVPSIKALDISKYYMKYLCAGGMPHKLPTSLVRLKELYLDVCLAEKNEISSALCMITSSPLLERIDFLMYDNEKLPVQQTPTNFLDPEDYQDVNLDHLVAFRIENFSNLPLEMDFVKLILVKSPELQEVRIRLNGNVSVDEELKMLRELLLFSFSRALPYAKLIIDRP